MTRRVWSPPTGSKNTASMLGYALAHLAWFRDERRPKWARYLRWAPRSVFKQGLRYLEETAGSSFKPIRLRKPDDDDD
jgi:hypothetical protein